MLVDSYTRRTTRMFSLLWSFFALGVATVAVLLGVTTDPAPDSFIVMYGATTGLGGAVCGFLHGVTLSAARNLDAQRELEQGKEEYRG
jgi:hypothetical protein